MAKDEIFASIAKEDEDVQKKEQESGREESRLTGDEIFDSLLEKDASADKSKQEDAPYPREESFAKDDAIDLKEEDLKEVSERVLYDVAEEEEGRKEGDGQESKESIPEEAPEESLSKDVKEEVAAKEKAREEEDLKQTESWQEAEKKFDQRPWYENLGRLTKAGSINALNEGFYKLASELARPISKDAHEYLADLSQYNREQVEEAHKGAHGWQKDVGSAIPSALKISGVVVGSTAVPAASAGLQSAYLTDMGVTAGGSAMNDYDEYKKSTGKSPYEEWGGLARWGVGAANAASEVFTERALGGISRYMPKRLKSVVGRDMINKLFRTTKGEKAFGKAVETFAKQRPSAWRKLAKNTTDTSLMALGEAGEESTNAIAQLAVESLYKEAEDDPTWNDWLKQTWDAAKGGALMAGMVAPVRGSARRFQRHQRRAQNGMPVAITNEGEAFEILGQKDNQLIGESPAGVEVTVDPENVVDQAFITPEEYNEYVEGLEQGMDQKIFEEAASLRNKKTGRVESFHLKTQDKEKESPVFLLDSDAQTAAIIDPNDNFKRKIVSADAVENEGLAAEFEDYVNAIKEREEEIIKEEEQMEEKRAKGKPEDFQPGQHVEFGGRIGVVSEVGTDGTMIVDTPEGSMPVPPEGRMDLRPAAIINLDDEAQVMGVETTEGLEIQHNFTDQEEANGMAQRLNEIYEGKKVFEPIREDSPDPNQPGNYKVIGYDREARPETEGEEGARPDVGPTPEGTGGEQAVQEQPNTISDGDVEHNVTELSEGNYQIGETTQNKSVIEQRKGKMEGLFEGKLSFEIEREPSGDNFTPDSYRLVAKPMGPEQQQQQQEDNGEPSYTIEGNSVSRGMAKMAIRKAKTPEDLDGLEIRNDSELEEMISEKFPQPEYSFEGDPMTREEVVAAIDNAETQEDLEGIEIKNDPEMEQYVQERFAEPEEQQAEQEQEQEADVERRNLAEEEKKELEEKYNVTIEDNIKGLPEVTSNLQSEKGRIQKESALYEIDKLTSSPKEESPILRKIAEQEQEQETPPEPEQEFDNEDQWIDYVERKSEDPDEIAMAYQAEAENYTPYDQLMPWQKEIVDGVKVKKESFVEHNDRANIKGALARKFFKKDGMTLDQLAQSLGFEGTADELSMIADFMVEVANNPSIGRKTTTRQNNLAKKYKDITGNSIKNHNFKDQENDVAERVEEWLKEKDPGHFGNEAAILERHKDELTQEQYNEFREEILNSYGPVAQEDYSPENNNDYANERGNREESTPEDQETPETGRVQGETGETATRGEEEGSREDAQRSGQIREEREATPEQRERINQRIENEVTAEENRLKNQLADAKVRKQNLKDRMDAGLNQQQSMFDDEVQGPRAEHVGEAVTTEQDGSQQNIQNQLREVNNEIAAIEREMAEFAERKPGLIQQIHDAETSQGDLFKKENQSEIVSEINSLPLTRVENLGMGQTQAKGIYLSTERENRYSFMGEPQPYSVRIDNPAVFDQNKDEYHDLRSRILNERQGEMEAMDFEGAQPVENPSVDDLSAQGLEKLGRFVTEYLQSQGYDSIYFTGEGENELVVFDPRNAWRKDAHIRELEDGVNALANDLGVTVNMVREAGNLPVQNKLSKKAQNEIQGYFDPQTGQIYIVADNVRDVEEARKVVLHEAIGHKGFRSILGENEAGPVLDGIYNSIPEMDRTNLEELYEAEQESVPENASESERNRIEEENQQKRRKIAEEYLASVAENYKRPGFLRKIAARVRNIIRKKFNVPYSTNDLMYILSRSEDAIRKDRSDGYVSFQDEGARQLQQGENPKDLGAYKRVSPADSPANLAQRGDRVRERGQDALLSVKRLQQEVKRRGGEVEWFQDAYAQENRSYGRVMYEMERFNKFYLKDLSDAIAQVTDDTSPEALAELKRYLKAKHAPERNKRIGKRKYEEGEQTGGLRAGMEENFSGFSTKEAESIIKEYEGKHDQEAIDNLWDKIRAISNYTLNRLKNDGLISQELFDELTKGEDAYQYYVPLKGFKNEELQSKWDYISKDTTQYISPLKKAEGRKTESDDPLEYLVNMAQGAIVTGESNRVKQYAYRMVKDNPNDDLYHIQKAYYVSTGEVDQQGRPITNIQFSRPPQEMFDKGLVTTRYNSKKMALNKKQDMEHTVQAWVGGEPVNLRFENPKAAQALNKQNILRPGAVGRFIGHGTRWLVQNFTAKNPAFYIPNAQRDIAYAWIAHAIKGESGDGALFAKRLGMANRAMTVYNRWEKAKEKARRAKTEEERNAAEEEAAELENKKVTLNVRVPGEGTKTREMSLYQIMEGFKANGGETGFVHLKDLDQIKDDLNDEIRKAERRKEHEGVNLIAFNEEGEVRFFNALGRRMESVAERSENMSRIATYIMALEKGKSPAEAATEAKNITVNFNRKGELSPIVGSFYGFVNAAIQGFENGSRLAYEHRGAFIKSAATFYSMGFLNALLSHMMVDDGEEDWYGGVNDYIKQNYFTIGYGEGKYVSIPLPHFHRAFYGAGVSTFENLFYDKVSGNHSEWIDSGKGLDKMGLDFLNLAIDMGSPVNPVEFLSKEGFSLMGVLKPFAPMTATPILDIVENRDFANRPVVKEPYTQGIDEHLANAGRFKRDVNGAAKWFTDKLFQAGGGDINTYAKRPIKGREVQDRVPIPMDINPSGVEHLVTYYFGGRGQFVNNLYKTVSSTVEGVNNAIEGKEAPFVDFDPNNVPILRRYNRKSYDYGLYNQYFQIQEEIDAYEFNLREMDRKEEIQSMNPKYMIMKEKLKSVEDRRKSIRERMNSPAIVGEPRKIKELREEEKELIQNFLNSLAQ